MNVEKTSESLQRNVSEVLDDRWGLARTVKVERNVP